MLIQFAKAVDKSIRGKFVLEQIHYEKWLNHSQSDASLIESKSQEMKTLTQGCFWSDVFDLSVW